MKIRCFSVKYYLKHPSVKEHCLRVLKRYWSMSKDPTRFDYVNDKMQRIMNKTLTSFWQDKYNVIRERGKR